MELKKAYDYFLLHLQKLNKSPHTVKQYGIDGKGLIKHLQTIGIHTCKDDVKGGFISYRKHLITESEFSGRSINRKISSMRSFLNYLYIAKWVGENYVDDIKQIPKQVPEVKILTKEELTHLKKYYRRMKTLLPEGHTESYAWIYERNHVMVQVLEETGITPQELINMKIGHYKGDHIYIQEGNLGFREVECPKSLENLIDNYLVQTEEKKKLELENHHYLWFGDKRTPDKPLNVKIVERIVRKLFEEIKSDKTAINIRYNKVLRNLDPMNYQAYGYSRVGTLKDRVVHKNKKR